MYKLTNIIVQITLSTLFATGVISTLIAISTNSSEASFSCALAAAVNFVAAAHYRQILWKRSQEPSREYDVLVDCSSNNIILNSKSNLLKMVVEEMAVDTLRHSDWAVTLFILVLDLYRLSEHATGGVKSWLNDFVAASFMPLVVFFGGVYRFYANELRNDFVSTRLTSSQFYIGIASFLISCTFLAITMSGILIPILANKGCIITPTKNTTTNSDVEKCEIVDANLVHDAIAVQVFTFIWIGYPIVSIISRMWLPNKKSTNRIIPLGYEQDCTQFCTTYKQVSIFKDICYAVLDVVSKSGLTVYVCYRTILV